ncbi:SAF domain-containing protein [Brevibacterium luteolum]|uniref:SAF domain-containing protein n=1 Tax=Brevibacterium luteolum TaxID=199591 RepID=UPI003B66B0EB
MVLSLLTRLTRQPASSREPQASTASAAVHARTALRRRRILGAAALAVATMLAVWLIIPRTGGTHVLVASSQISAGTELTAADVSLVRFPPDLVPAGALTETAAVVGATATSEVAAGAVLTEHALLTPRAEPLPEGMVALPVEVGDGAAAQVLRPGHHVRVFAAGTGSDPAGDPLTGLRRGPAVVEDAVVESIQQADAGSSPLDRSTVVVLRVHSDEAAALADIAGSALSFAVLN